MEEQLNLFAASYEKPELPKHIRLIEFFAGIGAQAKALEILGADFEHWRTCEWSWQSIIAYNAIHIKTTEDYSKPFPYEEILNALEGISHDYNKPMTRKDLMRRGEAWARKVYNAMVGNNNYCPNVSNLHAKDLDIRDRKTIPTSLPIPSHVRIYPTRVLWPGWTKAVERGRVYYGKSKGS